MNLFVKISYRVQCAAEDLHLRMGLRDLSTILNGPGKRILTYHGVDQAGRKNLNARFIADYELEAQLRYLSQHAQCVSLDDYYAENYDKKRFAVCITFDDGYQNNLDYALPLLEKYKVPATFFLTGVSALGKAWLWMDFLDVATRLGPDAFELDGMIFRKKKAKNHHYYVNHQGQSLARLVLSSNWDFIERVENTLVNLGAWDHADSWSDYWKTMQHAAIKKLSASPYASIGAHGYSHLDLVQLPHNEAVEELKQVKRELEKITGTPVKSLAYPFGHYTRALVDSAAAIGFTQQLALDYLYADDVHDPRLRDRMGINPYISMVNQLLALKTGRYA
jgi:peptidoglycan/xylan/chitin deacetylase (PgdA/CDA1 family)